MDTDKIMLAGEKEREERQNFFLDADFSLQLKWFYSNKLVI